jgi:hypothetical protein
MNVLSLPKSRRRILRTKNQWLGVVFFLYLALIPVFGEIYDCLYRAKAGEFGHPRMIFNSDVVNGRLQERRLQWQRDIPRYQKEIKALSQLQDAIRSGVRPMHTEALVSGVLTRSHFRTSEYFYDVETYSESVNSDTMRFERRYLVNITDETGQLSESVVLSGPPVTTPLSDSANRWIASSRDPIESGIFEEVIDTLLLRLQGDYKALIELLNSLDANTDIWSYWDFVYFSTITQTTVGYGDILPNSTVVRMVVCVQVLLGLLLLGIAINLWNFDAQPEHDQNPQK